VSPPGTAVTSGLLYRPKMINEDDCGAIGGMKIGRANRSTRRKLAPAPLSPPQIPHDQTRARTPGRRGGKPATNRLSYGAALTISPLNTRLELKQVYWLRTNTTWLIFHGMLTRQSINTNHPSHS
jgi:hypothetical protein